MADFTEIWNTAYNLLAQEDCNGRAAREYLRQQADAGRISKADADQMYEDIKETYSL